jgi:hypothetical protein
MRLNRLAAKGINLGVRTLDGAAWRRVVQADPGVPRNAAQLRRLWNEINARKRDRKRQSGPARVVETCGDDTYGRFYTGLANPLLRPEELDGLDAMMARDLPDHRHVLETEHFVLRWTDRSPDPADNIDDPGIIKETAGYLEAAWERFQAVFSRTPFLPEGATRMEVEFRNLGAGIRGIASPPEGPIKLDAEVWRTEPSTRRSTSAHELFHKLQHAFGFRTRHTPTGFYQWFNEGSADWAAVFMWQQLALPAHLTGLFANPNRNVFNSFYDALPFWLFVDTHLRRSADDVPMADFMRRYESSGDERKVLSDVIAAGLPAGDVYGKLDHFIAWFARERLTGGWRTTPAGGQPYATILGPDGAPLNPQLAVTDIPVAKGQPFRREIVVTPFGATYFRFRFADDAGGRLLKVSVKRSGCGNFAYHSIWRKGGRLVVSSFPHAVSGDLAFTEKLDPAVADELVLIVSGRKDGGLFTLNAAIT